MTQEEGTPLGWRTANIANKVRPLLAVNDFLQASQQMR